MWSLNLYSPVVKIMMILMLSLNSNSVSLAQDTSGYFVTLSVARFTPLKTLFGERANAKLNLVNGFQLGKSLGPKSEIYLSLMKDFSNTEWSLIGTYSRQRYQIGIGMNHSVTKGEKFNVDIGLEGLINRSRYRGFVDSDLYPSFVSLDNLSLFGVGLSGQIQFNYSINDRCSIGFNSRAGVYSREEFEVEFIRKSSNVYVLLEPVNMIALRFNL